MTWVKLDDTFAEDPRFEEAGPLALALYVAALCYCSRQLTDGHITRSMTRRLLPLDDPDAVQDALVHVGMFKPTETGFEVVDYLTNQFSAEKVREQRAAKAERQKKWRDSQRGASSSASTPTSRNASTGQPRDASQDAAPPRTRPAPKEGRGRGAQDGSAGATPTSGPIGNSLVPPHDWLAPPGVDEDDLEPSEAFSMPCHTCGTTPQHLVHWAHKFTPDTDDPHVCGDCLEPEHSRQGITVHEGYVDYLRAKTEGMWWPPQ